MKKKILISLLVSLLLVCAVAVGVFAADSTGVEETFRVYKASLTLGVDLRFNLKVQTGTLPEGVNVSDVKLLVWEGATDGVDYTVATKDTAGCTQLTNPVQDENGLLVFTYDGVTAAEMGKTLYLRAYYTDGTQDVYTEAKRYSMAQYLHCIYKAEGTTEKENDVIESLFAYGDAAQELVLNPDDALTLPKISDGVVEVTVSGGKFADGFTTGKFLTGEALNVTADESGTAATQLTATLGNDLCWATTADGDEDGSADGYLGYKSEIAYKEGMFVDAVANYKNIFEVTVNETSNIYKDDTLLNMFALANGGTVKLLADVDIGDQDVQISASEGNTINVTLDLNGKKITSTAQEVFGIFENATLTVQDTVGGGITTTGASCFYASGETSVLNIKGGTFNSTDSVFSNSDGTVNVTGGTFSSDPSAYLTNDSACVMNNGVYTATAGDYICEVTVNDTTNKYASLGAAVANANDGTVTLTKDVDLGEGCLTIPEGKTVTLDLNGFEITSIAGCTIDNYEKLTVKDSGTTGKIGKIINTNIYGYGIYNNGYDRVELTIEGGTITSNSFNVYNVDKTVTIKGGTFSSIYNFGGTVNIEGGTFNSNSGNNIHNESGTVTITGGTFSSDPSDYVNKTVYSVTQNTNANTWTVDETPGVF